MGYVHGAIHAFRFMSRRNGGRLARQIYNGCISRAADFIGRRDFFSACSDSIKK